MKKSILERQEMKYLEEKNLIEWGTPSNIQLARSSYLTYGSFSGSNSESPIGHSREELKMSLQTSYTLKSPPLLTYRRKLSSVVLNKTKSIFVNISWWIYLITCYSLLLDTCILQSRAVMLIRCLLRKYANRRLGSYLLLFILLPVCLATGGYEYFALHGLNSTFTLTYPSHATLPNHETVPKCLPEITSNTEGNEQEKLISYAVRKDITEKLKFLNEEMQNLKEKLTEYDTRIAGLSSGLDPVVLSEMLQSISEAHINSTLNSMLSEASESFQLRLEKLTAQHQKEDEQQVDKIVSLSVDINSVLSEVEMFRRWRLEADGKLANLAEMMMALQQFHGNLEQKLLSASMASLDEKMKLFAADTEQKISNKFKTDLISEVMERTKLEVFPSRGLDMSEVKKMIDFAISLYDADKIGIADYALESSGGIVLSTRCTEAFNGHRPRISIWGFTLWSEPNNPRVVIQPGIVPGHCWSFKGFDGYLVIQLSRTIFPTSFTLEHIPLSIAPDGNIASAPRNFSVYGLRDEADSNGVKLGEYFYDNSGPPLQMFPVQREHSETFTTVELRIHSNYGNPDYTCLYRFRVHGHIIS